MESHDLPSSSLVTLTAQGFTSQSNWAWLGIVSSVGHFKLIFVGLWVKIRSQRWLKASCGFNLLSKKWPDENTSCTLSSFLSLSIIKQTLFILQLRCVSLPPSGGWGPQFNGEGSADVLLRRLGPQTSPAGNRVPGAPAGCCPVPPAEDASTLLHRWDPEIVGPD